MAVRCAYSINYQEWKIAASNLRPIILECTSSNVQHT